MNPYRDAERGLVDSAFKPKLKKSGTMCSTRATFLLALIFIVCGSYYLHIGYFKRVSDRPSVRGSISSYRSFTESVKDFAADMQHDLVAVDQNRDKPFHPIDLKKPIAPSKYSGKVNTFVASAEPPVKEVEVKRAIPAEKRSPEAIMSEEVINKIQAEKFSAYAVEDKVIDLAKHAQEFVHRPVVMKPKPADNDPESGKSEQLQAEANQKEQQRETNKADAEPIEKNEDIPPPLENEHPNEQPNQVAAPVEGGALQALVGERDREAANAAPKSDSLKQAPLIVPDVVLSEKDLHHEMDQLHKDIPRTSEIHVDSPHDAAAHANADAAGLEHKPEEQHSVQPPAIEMPLDAAEDQHHQIPQEIVKEQKKNVEKEALHDLPDPVKSIKTAKIDAPPVKPPMQETPIVKIEPPQDAVDVTDADTKANTGATLKEIENPKTTTADPPVEETKLHQEHAEDGRLHGEHAEEHDAPASRASPDVAEPPRTDNAPPVNLAPPQSVEPPLEVAPISGQEAIGEKAKAPDGAVAATTTALNRPTGFDLPALKVPAPKDSLENSNKEKIDYCAGHDDPFAGIPVDNFTPPAAADFETVQQWRNAVNEMVRKISKVNYGGDELRTLIRTEVESLQLMRFKMFCQFA